MFKYRIVQNDHDQQYYVQFCNIKNDKWEELYSCGMTYDEALEKVKRNLHVDKRSAASITVIEEFNP